MPADLHLIRGKGTYRHERPRLASVLKARQMSKLVRPYEMAKPPGSNNYRPTFVWPRTSRESSCHALAEIDRLDDFDVRRLAMYRVDISLCIYDGWSVTRCKDAEWTFPAELHPARDIVRTIYVAGGFLQHSRGVGQDFVYGLPTHLNTAMVTDLQRIRALRAGRSNAHQQSKTHKRNDRFHSHAPRRFLCRPINETGRTKQVATFRPTRRTRSPLEVISSAACASFDRAGRAILL